MVPMDKEKNLIVRGCDVNMNPYSLFTKVSLYKGDQKLSESTKEPFKLPIPKTAEVKNLNVKLEFHGHYNEAKYNLDLDLEELHANKNVLTYMIVYNPFS
jgi:hypothetical protein